MTAVALTPGTESLLWRVEKVVLMALGGLFALLAIVFILTFIGLRGRPRDFDSIMVDDTDSTEDRGYTSPHFRR